MTRGIGRNQKPGVLIMVSKQRLKRIAELLTIHTFGGRGSPLADFLTADVFETS
jgi:hypothetical protein